MSALWTKPRPNLFGGYVMKPFTTIAIAVFTLVAVVHLLRLVFGWEVVVTGYVVPVWWSALGLIVAGGLALMVWREARAP
jgi:hypothetical protein